MVFIKHSVFFFFLCLTCLNSSLFAETIGTVNYQFSLQGWKIANEYQTDKKIISKTVIYIPENAIRETAEEFFGVHGNNLPSGGMDQASLEKTLQAQFPSQQIHLTILNTDSHSETYEWTAGDQKLTIYGLTRSFSTPEGSVLMMYQAKDKNTFIQKRHVFLEMLKNATISP